jgi:predicted acyltransferase
MIAMAELARDARVDSRHRAFDAPARHHRLHPAQPATYVKPERASSEARQAAQTRRVVSVDALRGFSMICILGLDAMALAMSEMAGDKPGFLSAIGRFLGDQFSHVEWEGFALYDFVFPLFVFVTGVAIVFSLSRMVEREGMTQAHLRVLRRFLLLYALGVIYYGGLSERWPDIRLLGVLQRIAICYLVASLLFLNLQWRSLVAVVVAILLGYWALMALVPVPGVGAGTFLPDANLARWIDAQYLPGSMWDGTSDPEGLFSTLPAIASCLLGVLAGVLLMNGRIEDQEKSLWLMGAGCVLVAAGHLWGLEFPIVKYIWTSSFVLLTGGYSLLMLGIMYQVIDVWGWRAWSTMLVWIGANAITLYLLHHIMRFDIVASRLVGGDVAAFLDAHVTPGTGGLLTAGVGLALAVALAGFLYRRKIFLRV